VTALAPANISAQLMAPVSVMTVLARKQGAALVIRDRKLGIFTNKGFTPVDFKVELAMKLATRLQYTPLVPAQEMEEPELLRFLTDTQPV
jgi:hypothetical protein